MVRVAPSWVVSAGTSVAYGLRQRYEREVLLLTYLENERHGLQRHVPDAYIELRLNLNPFHYMTGHQAL